MGSGLSGPVVIKVTGSTYNINGASFTSANGTINNGDLVQIQFTSSSTSKAKVTAAVQWPKVKIAFNVMTR